MTTLLYFIQFNSWEETAAPFCFQIIALMFPPWPEIIPQAQKKQYLLI